jgi:hypothetical protein
MCSGSRISDERGAAVTPERATQRKAWTYALIGAGIACLIAAYQFAFTTPKEGAPSLTVGLLFTAIAVVSFIAAAILAAKVRASGTAPATTDLSAPGGSAVKILLVVGFGALAGTWLVRFITPEDELLGITLSGMLLVIAAVCLINAGRLAKMMRKTRASGSTKQ